MGIFDDALGGLFGRAPSAPDMREFSEFSFLSDPRFDQGLRQMDDRYLQALMKYSDREPGFTEAEKNELYNIPAEQSKFAEAASLRRLNQGSAAGGAYHSGGRMAGRGDILRGFGATRADLRRKVLTDSAKVALQDRLNQLASMANYTNARIGQGLQHTAMRNNYNNALNQYALQQYGMDLSQYNANQQKGLDMATAAFF